MSDTVLNLSGEALDVPAYEALRAALANPPAGFSIGRIEIVPPAVAQFRFAVEKSARGIVLDGFAPSAVDREAALRAAAEAVPGGTVQDRLLTARGLDPAIDPKALIGFAFKLAELIQAGTVTFAEDTIAVTGDAIDAQAIPDAAALMREARPAGVKAGRVALAARPLSPYRVAIRRTPEAVTLTGHLPDDATRERVLAALRPRLFREPVVDRTRLADGAPPDLGTALAAAAPGGEPRHRGSHGVRPGADAHRREPVPRGRRPAAGQAGRGAARRLDRAGRGFRAPARRDPRPGRLPSRGRRDAGPGVPALPGRQRDAGAGLLPGARCPGGPGQDLPDPAHRGLGPRRPGQAEAGPGEGAAPTETPPTAMAAPHEAPAATGSAPKPNPKPDSQESSAKPAAKLPPAPEPHATAKKAEPAAAKPAGTKTPPPKKPKKPKEAADDPPSTCRACARRRSSSICSRPGSGRTRSAPGRTRRPAPSPSRCCREARAARPRRFGPMLAALPSLRAQRSNPGQRTIAERGGSPVASLRAR
ncbi:hypothetical protein MBRA_00226 [Methylobacterium brachiatum]|nr:hypothetical protein MBRA_00226 [Methylobacterium brachiatum]